MMPRLYLRLGFIPLIFFTVALLVLRAQPYDDHNLRQLLPEGCPMPCFMGIRPGITRQEEAEKLLNENGWVEKITFADNTYISWTWSGEQPAWINQTSKGSLSLSDDKVATVQFSTHIRFGDIQLDMGTKGILEQWAYQTGYYAIYTISYPDYHLKLDFTIDCKNRIRYLQPVNIIVGAELSENSPNFGRSLPWSFFRC